MNSLVNSFRRLSTSSQLLANKRGRTQPRYYMEPYPEDRGIQLYNETNGERTKLKDAEDRFKRLDWGMYIRTRAGRSTKLHKISPGERWNLQQHVFTARWHTRDLNKMMDNSTKKIRHFPEDIYDKYNKMDFALYKALKTKNMERIRMHGNNVYRFNRWKAHRSIQSKYNTVEKETYEPPGFLQVVKDNKGVFLPSEKDQFPLVEAEPHFHRDPIQTGGRCRKLIELRDLEQFCGRIKPWNPLLRRRLFMGSKR
uniref:39S ribosomal protein L35, mitochondriallike [Ceratitis capitata] n=1 Tax=Lepeophtheirus salmonis TaxID=72036 RepID=A0A0K2TP00_LEPSM